MIKTRIEVDHSELPTAKITRNVRQQEKYFLDFLSGDISQFCIAHRYLVVIIDKYKEYKFGVSQRDINSQWTGEQLASYSCIKKWTHMHCFNPLWSGASKRWKRLLLTESSTSENKECFSLPSGRFTQDGYVGPIPLGQIVQQ